MYNVGVQDRKERIEYFSKIFEIHDFLNDKVQSYSHGMRQKLIIIGGDRIKLTNKGLDLANLVWEKFV